MLSRLLSHPGVVEELVLAGPVGFLAFHGGSLERHTDEIARRAATRAGASFYAIVQPPELRWHIPSRRVDPAASPHLAAFLDRVTTAIAIHGYGRQDLFTTILLGGRNRELARTLGRALRRQLPHYEVRDEVDSIPRDLRGQHPANPVNRPHEAGVQVELPPRVRGMGPYWDGWPHDEPNPHTEALVSCLAEVAAGWASSG